MTVAPSVKAANAPKLKKLALIGLGDRPQAASGTLTDEGGRAPVGLSIFPLDQTTRSVVFAPDGRSGYAICSRGLVQFNPVTFALSRSVKTSSARRIKWCGNKLIVIGKPGEYYEYVDGGRFQAHTERPPTAASRLVKTLEFWVVDPKTLEVEAGYLAYGDRLICAKDAPIAVGLDSDFSFDLIDVNKGNRLARYSVGDFAAEFGWKPEEDPAGRPHIEDIYVSYNGESLHLLVGRKGGTRICRFDRQGKTLKLSAESEPCQPDPYIYPDLRLFAAPDESFIAYRGHGNIRNHEGDGFVVFPMPDLGKAVGGVAADKGDRQLAFDVQRKLALTFGPSGAIGVVSDKGRRDLTVREEGQMLPLDRIDSTQFSYAPHLKSVVLLAGDISSAIQIVDKAGKDWPFAPPSALLPDLKATKMRSPKGARPTPPLRFEVDPDIKPTVLTVADTYSSAWYQIDGKAFFLWSSLEKRVSRFNGKSGVEERRVELANLNDEVEWEMQVGANDVVLKSSTGEELITLDPQTLDAKLKFTAPESLIVRTAPGSPFAVVAAVSTESEHKGLRLVQLADGKTVDTLRFDDVFDLLNDQQRQEAHSVWSVRNIEMSLDGSLCFVVFNDGRLYSLFNLDDGKFAHVESYTRRESAASDEGSECPAALWAHCGWENIGTKDFKQLTKTPKPFQGIVKLEYETGPYAIDASGRTYFPSGGVVTRSPTGEEVPVPGFEGKELKTDWIAIDPTRPGRVLYSLSGWCYWVDLNQRK